MNIFFDLDGTLLDSRERLYLLFQHLVPVSKFSFDEYWEFKRNKIGHNEILENYFFYTKKEIESFEKRWLERIELSEWLALDKPFDGVSAYLKELKKTHNLFVVTARQSEVMLLEQIAKYSWIGLFEKILITSRKQEKHDLLKNRVVIKKTDWIVGDTGKDIQTGKILGIKTAAVLSGFLSKEKILQYEPDIIVDSVLDLKF